MTTHFLDGISIHPVCGLRPGARSASTTIPTEVTCRGCRNSILFRGRFPELPAGHKKGRKPGQGRQVTSKFWVPPHLLTWWEQQSPQAATIVQGLELLAKQQAQSDTK